ncbi:MAG TPA: hypothetical protein PKD49_09655 [Hyphomicrobium sp.]|nr:hypothetical protein [Hyphomicrobium sp.]
MNTIIKRAAGAGIWAGAAVMALTCPPLHADESCVSDWGAAGSIVRSQGLRTIEQVARDGGDEVPGTIVQATLCQSGARYIYRLVVRVPTGALKNVVVEAKADAGAGK